jgi:hypothetical protein
VDQGRSIRQGSRAARAPGSLGISFAGDNVLYGEIAALIVTLDVMVTALNNA